MRGFVWTVGLHLAFMCFAPRIAFADESDLARRLDTQKSVLQQLESDLVQARSDAARIKESEQDAAQQYVEATNRVSLIEHSIRELVRTETQLRADIREAVARRERITSQVTDRERITERRVRTLYMQGRRQPFQRALLASSLAHWMAARQYLTTLNRRDRIDINHLLEDRADLDSLTAIYRDQRATLDTLISRRRRQRADLVGARRDAERYLDRIRRNRQLAERAAQELATQREASQERISEYLAQLHEEEKHANDGDLVGGASVAAPVDFSAEKGRLPWPVRGRVMSSFGRQRDAETRTWTRNRGIDISAPRGTDIRAVAPGRVVMVDWFRGYGTFIIVAHGQDYYTLYAHLDGLNVRQDDHVRQGQVVGVSGEGGTLGEEKVHFELLAGHEALNPLDWLIPGNAGS